MSLLTRGAWIEIVIIDEPHEVFLSLLTRGAWIEIVRYCPFDFLDLVAPHTRSVD